MRPVEIAEAGERRADRPDQPLWKPFGEFLDSFYEAEGGRAGMLVREPPARLDRNEAAYLAAATEHLCLTYRLPIPAWVEDPRYFLDRAYWPESRSRALETICLAESPVSFRRRFIFTEAQPLRRKGGPRSPD